MPGKITGFFKTVQRTDVYRNPNLPKELAPMSKTCAPRAAAAAAAAAPPPPANVEIGSFFMFVRVPRHERTHVDSGVTSPQLQGGQLGCVAILSCADARAPRATHAAQPSSRGR